MQRVKFLHPDDSRAMKLWNKDPQTGFLIPESMHLNTHLGKIWEKYWGWEGVNEWGQM